MSRSATNRSSLGRHGRRALAVGTIVATASVTGAAITQVSGANTYDGTAVAELDQLAGLVGARDLWACGFGGKGVDVALIDTGVAPVPGTGRIYNGPDLSFDAQTGAPPHLDAYGHGTHLASLINGRDPGVVAPPTSACRSTRINPKATDDTGFPRVNGFAGMAPDARVVNLKAGAADGAVDVTQVIAAIDWAVQNRNRNGLNIRVLAIPYGVSSSTNTRRDPLSHAVDVANANGILVVAASGNDGTTRTDLAYPARNPDVVAVGAADRAGRTGATTWTVADFSDRGTANRNPDLLVPAVMVPGLRVPGSYLDLKTTTQGNRMIRGSGTSQATAIVAGVAAQLVQRYPAATTAQLKDMLTRSTWTARTGGVLKRVEVLHANKLLGIAPKSGLKSSLPVQTTGVGQFDELRSDSRLSLDGVVLTGERDVLGRSLPSATWAPASLNRTSWSNGAWMGGVYSATPTPQGVPTAGWASSWSGQPWGTATPIALSGTPATQPVGAAGIWDGVKWRATDFNGVKWRGSGWDGVKWRGAVWQGVKWRSMNFDGVKWRGSGWSSAMWE